MSCNYADGLSPYHDKGQLGLEEKFDTKTVVSAKVALLAKWINEAKHVVIHTGAGISTSAGIPDFRGPRGVWTLQAKGEKPDLSTDFNEAIPTVTHMAITKLVEKGKVKYVVSQNIDGLHLRSNLQRKCLSELHGNMFIEQCNACNRQFVRSNAVPTVGQKSLNKSCPTLKPNGRPCRGKLHDCILDWEHNLPENDLGMADFHSCMSDLSICLGTTMQIVPSGNLPLYTKKHGGKLVICNLQPTKHDRKADLLIHAYVDEVMTMLMKNLNLKIPKYTAKNDPTKTVALTPDKFMEWTISDYAVKKMKKIYEEKCGTKEARKRLEMIDDDLPLSISKNIKRTKGKEDEDSDLEVLDVIVKPKKDSSKRGQKKNSLSYATVTVKKVPQPAKKAKYEGEKITIKKNVTPTKTKYEIVQPKPKKIPKCEIVYGTDSDLCHDLDMTCESDDDDNPPNFTYNFKLYLQDNKEPKTEVVDDDEKSITKFEDAISECLNEKSEEAAQVKEEIKMEESETLGLNDKATDNERTVNNDSKKENVSVDNHSENKNLQEKKKSERDIAGIKCTEKTSEESSVEKQAMASAVAEGCVRELSVGTENLLPTAKESLSENSEKPADKVEESKEDSRCTIESELDKYIKVAERERSNSNLESDVPNEKCDKDETVTDKEDDLSNNIESEIPNLTKSNDDQQVSTTTESQFGTSINRKDDGNFNFYANEGYQSSSAQPDLEYVTNSFYNNF